MTSRLLPTTVRSSGALGPHVLLRAEGAAVVAGATAAYFLALSASPWLFLLVALAPDLSMLAYLAGPRVGAAGYNLAHTIVGPLALAGVALWAGAPTALAVALVWAAHVGADRALGYGLKHPTGFGDTHLGRIGRANGDGPDGALAD